MDVTVVIPTHNAGSLFRKVLARVLDQDYSGEMEVVVVDTDSQDGTRAFLAEQAKENPQIRVYSIKKEEFGHGKTRNFGIKQGTGRYIAMLTQDALPRDREWLRHLIAPLEQDEKVAGVFGRHLAYPEHGPFLQRDLDIHFRQFEEASPVVSLDDPERYAKDEPYRQFLHFFSDNNAALRRSVWEKIPYPDVAFGEDQLWAEAILKAGWGKAYASQAVVYHSHFYGPRETFLRSEEESRYFTEKFGYRLCDSRRQVWRYTRKQTWRDWRYVWKQKSVFRHWRFLAQAPWINYAKINGHYRGGLPSGEKKRSGAD